MPRFTRRRVLTAAASAAALASLPGGARAKTQRLILNDASRLNPTPIHAHWIVGANEEAGLVARLRAELKAAASERRPVVVGAARHSMGGQALPRDGIAITLNINRVEPDRGARTYRVHAGTRWHEVIKALDPIGFSPAVMQSNADFGIAATFSVNAHGWPTPYGPFGATVRGLEIMLADGSVVRASRTENAEIFRHAMGGYGFFGIILSLDVDMVENLLLRPTYQTMATRDFSSRFMSATRDASVQMLYGRLSVARDGFLERALLVSYRPVAPQPANLPAVSDEGFASGLTRRIYRAQIGSETAKKARWFAETVAGPRAASGIATRNSLMTEPVSNLANTDRARTDILHEYFVPPDRFVDFVKACQDVILPSGQELINITLRYVAADETSVMSFAPTPRIAGVMSFAQAVTPEAEASMLRMTEALIERVGAIGGAFYLPYRLHARPDQVTSIYRNTPAFAARKRELDPALVFRNAMWHAYFANGA